MAFCKASLQVRGCQAFLPVNSTVGGPQECPSPLQGLPSRKCNSPPSTLAASSNKLPKLLGSEGGWSGICPALGTWNSGTVIMAADARPQRITSAPGSFLLSPRGGFPLRLGQSFLWENWSAASISMPGNPWIWGSHGSLESISNLAKKRMREMGWCTLPGLLLIDIHLFLSLGPPAKVRAGDQT